jgi:hypothetical protein
MTIEKGDFPLIALGCTKAMESFRLEVRAMTLIVLSLSDNFSMFL